MEEYVTHFASEFLSKAYLTYTQVGQEGGGGGLLYTGLRCKRSPASVCAIFLLFKICLSIFVCEC